MGVKITYYILQCGKVSLTQLCEYPESLKELLMVPHKILLILEITSEIIIVHLHHL